MEEEANDITDEDLMMSYAAGDADAFETLYQRYRAPMYRFIQRQCDQHMADELFQDVWLKVINARFEYKVTASFRTWLYKIARNRIIDLYRKNTIRVVDDTEEVGEMVDVTTAQPDKHLHHQSQYEILLTAITGLPSDQKEVFLLREEAGLSVNQIADTCGINFETAKSRLRYAVKKLRQTLWQTADTNWEEER